MFENDDFSVDYSGNEALAGGLSTTALSVANIDNNNDSLYLRTTDSGYIVDGGYQKSNSSTAAGFNFQDNGDETLTGTLHARSVVFITPENDCNGLYVQKTINGFNVRELRNGRSNIAFDYRIVAKPFDEDGRRLAVAPIERPFIASSKSSNRFALLPANRSAIAARHRAMLHTFPVGSRNIDPLVQLKARLGPAKFAAALAAFNRKQH